MVKKVKKMVELESKIREREIEIEKREIEMIKKEENVNKTEEEEKKKKEEEDERERVGLENEKKMRKEREEEEKLKKIEEELEKQLVIQQAQIKTLLEEKEVKIPQIFNGTSSKVSRFVEDYRKYTERKMKGEKTEEKICWIVSYVQGDQTDKWKERIVDEMFENKWKNKKVEDILKEIEREFRKGKKVEEDIWKRMDGFWNTVKEKKEVEKKKMPIVVVTTLRVQMARRGGKSGF